MKMKLYPNAKINLGLNILRKRPDGYHDLETIFYPIGLCDELEITKSKQLELVIEGNTIEGDLESNLVVKAFRILENDFQLSPVKIWLNKIIPTGAGLGGGSSDAAYTLIALNSIFKLQLSNKELAQYAAKLGADCAFFIYNQPMLGEGIGDRLTPISVALDGCYLALVKPDCFVSTAVAYANVQPAIPAQKVEELIQQPIERWNSTLKNDFEASIFPSFPEIEKVKEQLYEAGAIYACMSGSGASVFGIFNDEPNDLASVFKSQLCWIEQMKKL